MGVEHDRDRQAALYAQRLEGVGARHVCEEFQRLSRALGGRQQLGKARQRCQQLAYHLPRVWLVGCGR